MTAYKNDASVLEALTALVERDRIHEQENMSDHTSLRIGGPADYFIDVETEEELGKLLRFLTKEEIPHLLVGNGSNLLFLDEGYRGVILHLTGDFQIIKRSGDTVTVGAARLLSSLAQFVCREGLSGLEPLSGIPGTVGGAVYMNAGAYGGETKDVVGSVNLMARDGSYVRACAAEEMAFAYRHSAVQESGEIVLSATYYLRPDEEEAIRERMNEFRKRRNAKQPVELPSAGSTFKRPEGAYAAALIEEAGLKGLRIGGAEVSEKHSGFLVNVDHATAADFLALMDEVARRVYENSGFRLEPEVRIIR